MIDLHYDYSSPNFSLPFRLLNKLPSKKWREQTAVKLNQLEVCFIIILILSGPAFSVVRQARGGLRGPDAKNQGKHQPIDMKLCMSHYIHNSIPHAKFEADSSSSFEGMTSQNFHRKKGTSH